MITCTSKWRWIWSYVPYKQMKINTHSSITMVSIQGCGALVKSARALTILLCCSRAIKAYSACVTLCDCLLAKTCLTATSWEVPLSRARLTTENRPRPSSSNSTYRHRNCSCCQVLLPHWAGIVTGVEGCPEFTLKLYSSPESSPCTTLERPCIGPFPTVTHEPESWWQHSRI